MLSLVIMRRLIYGSGRSKAYPKARVGPAVAIRSKPREDGFRMPAEWEEHDG